MLSAYPKVIAAIPAASGAPASPNVKCGSIDPSGRVAFSDERNDIAHLVVAAGGRILLERALAYSDTSDYGYEGCSVENIEWLGDKLVVMTRERSTTRALRVDLATPGEPPAVLIVSGARVIDSALLLWEAEEPGLLRAVDLPSFAPVTPLPIRGAPTDLMLLRWSGGVIDVEQRSVAFNGTKYETMMRLPSAAQRPMTEAGDDFFALVEHRLLDGEPAPPNARLIVETVALPFCQKPPAEWRPTPAWLTLYWHRHLVQAGNATDAAELLSLLDGLAAPLPESEPERGWDESWDATEGAIVLATHHVRRQSRVLAAACREGTIPRGRWCLLFDPMPGKTEFGSRIDAKTLPPVARKVFETLAATSPARFEWRP